MTLRPYQREALTEISNSRAEGVNQQLVVWPCGSGKTILAANLPAYLPMLPGERMLFLCHRDELITQTEDKFHRQNPSMSITVEKGERHADLSATLTIASVQSLWREKRRTKFPRDHFSYIVYDEVHNALAKQNLEILRHFRVLKGEPDFVHDRFLIGLTATSERTDNQGMERIVDKITYSKSILEMMRDGWLVDIHAYRINSDVSLKDVRTRGGDFVPEDLTRTVNTPARNQLIVDQYEKLGENMPAFCFSAGIQHSTDLEKAFQERGYNFKAISSETPMEDRREAMNLFRQGRLRGLISCQVLSEGTDLPVASVGIMAGPTKSNLKYIQQIGRTLRPFPAPEESDQWRGWRKPYSIILDFVDVTDRHQLVVTPTIFGLAPSFDTKGASMMDTIEEIEEEEDKHPSLNLRECHSLADIKSLVERVDLLRPPEIPTEIRRISNYPWLRLSPFSYHLGLIDGSMIRVTQDALGSWQVRISKSGNSILKFASYTLDEAIVYADKLIPRSSSAFLATNSYRMQMEPTYEQAKALYSRDKSIRGAFSSVPELHRHMLEEHGRGNQDYTRSAVSRMIDRCTQSMPSWLREKINRKRAVS